MRGNLAAVPLFTIFVIVVGSTSVSFEDAIASNCKKGVASELEATNTALAAHKQKLKELVRDVMTRRADDGGAWTSCKGSCDPTSMRWYMHFFTYYSGPFKFQRIWYENIFDRQRFTVHGFVLEMSTEMKIIIDPTWKQFLKRNKETESLDEVFVGTQEDLIAALTLYKKWIVAPWFKKVDSDVRRLVLRTWPVENPGRGLFQVDGPT